MSGSFVFAWLASSVLSVQPTAAASERIEEGPWALHVDVVGQRQVPLLGAVRTAIVTDAFLDVRREDGRLVAHQTTCAITNGSALYDGGASPALVAGLPELTWELAVDGAHVQAQVGPLTMGYRGGAVPLNASDPRVFDPDGNGRPGAAMHIQVPGIGGFEIDVLATSTTEIDGQLVAPGLVRGSAVARMSERVVAGLPFQTELGALVVDPARSSFTLTRLPAGTRGCASMAGSTRTARR